MKSPATLQAYFDASMRMRDVVRSDLSRSIAEYDAQLMAALDAEDAAWRNAQADGWTMAEIDAAYERLTGRRVRRGREGA